MNWNYGIRLSGKPERFVMRFYDRAPDACAKEARILARLGADVPVPRVLHAEVRGIGGYPPFCVLEFIDGISLRELRRRGDVKGVADASYDAGGTSRRPSLVWGSSSRSLLRVVFVAKACRRFP